MSRREYVVCDVYLREVATGKTAVHREEYGHMDDHDPEQFNDFIWSEGNYSCDCNRRLFMARALGEDEPDGPCGDGDIVVDKIVRVSDGRVLYSEAEAPDGR